MSHDSVSSVSRNFKAQLGNSKHPGWLPQSERLQQIQPGQNPYVPGEALQGNSPVFFGRRQVMHEIASTLKRPNNPGCVSLLGERRIGKSSLLNQMVEALGKEQDLVTIHGTAQNWTDYTPESFFHDLHQSIVQVLPTSDSKTIQAYPAFRDFIESRAKQYRFVLLIDEFEAMTKNPHFGEEFFSNLRVLGERSEYAWGYLIASRRPLPELCQQHDQIAASSFWNIFGLPHVLGLLQKKEAEQLLHEPMQRSLSKKPFKEDRVIWQRAGHHPAFIQMVMEHVWSAQNGGFTADINRIHMGLRLYYADLLHNRTPEDREILLKILGKESLPETSTVSDLKQRGVVTVTGKFFSSFFEKFLLEGPLSGKNLGQISEAITIEKIEMPYQLPDISPYVVGEGLSNDSVFVGRTELLHWLHGLWKQPEGKPALVLVGQRRIGKTSLLNKLQRDGLDTMNLLPVVVNIQGCNSAFDFLQDVARKMADSLDMEKPVLNVEGPYADFKSYLLDLKPTLKGRRFLLMLDEADLIPERHLGDLLPGFLRTLMQDAEYPTLLLFCGTHALKRIGQEYSSILFNTAQVRTVSYMTAMESKEVLEKPAQGILEFSPVVLDQAYRFTQGQPLLLQMIGSTLIQQFNSTVFAEEVRSNYVDLNDFEKAVDTVVQQESNMAFENHWNDVDWNTRRILSGLAWTTDESNRLQLDIHGIEAALEEVRLTVSHSDLFSILERLCEEEMLLSVGPTYRFAVPLYRRWISWRWNPNKVRDATPASHKE